VPDGVDDEERRDNRAAIRGPREIAPATSSGRFLGGVVGGENAARGSSSPRMGNVLASREASHLRNWRNCLV